MKNSVTDTIAELFERQGQVHYTGPREEPVTALQHALQCAWHAEQSNAPDTLVVAALLHDIGHFVMLNKRVDDTTDDCHETVGARWLSRWFPAEVTEPVRLHVDAKRALCATNAHYFDSLSPASKHSLVLQGGVFDEKHLFAFTAQPFAEQAMSLRQWDDLAKQPNAATPGLEHYLALIQRVSGAAIN